MHRGLWRHTRARVPDVIKRQPISWKGVSIPNIELTEFANRQMKKLFTPRIEEWISDDEGGKELLADVPMLALFVMDVAYENSGLANKCKFEGLMHPNHKKYIKRIILIEASVRQVYVAEKLHRCIHGNVLRQEKEAFVTYCDNAGFRVEVAHSDVRYQEFSCESDNGGGPDICLRVANLEARTGGVADVDWDKLIEEYDSIDFDELMYLSLRDRKDGVNERGNNQKSIGLQVQNLVRDPVSCMAGPGVSSEAKDDFAETFCKGSSMLESLKYPFPDSDDEYNMIMSHGARKIHVSNRADAMTGISTFYRFKQRDRGEGRPSVSKPSVRNEEIPGSNQRPPAVISTEKFKSIDLLRAHVDRGNALDPGRTFSEGVFKIGYVYELVLDEKSGCWVYKKTGISRCGATFYCKRGVTLFARKSEFLDPLIMDHFDFYINTPEWQKDLSKIYQGCTSGNDDDEHIPLHLDPMHHISKIVDAFTTLEKKFPNRVALEHVVEFGMIFIAANCLDRVEEIVEEWDNFPDEHLAISYFRAARNRWGCVSGGENARKQVSFTTEMEEKVLYAACPKILGLVEEINEKTKGETCRSKNRGHYYTLVRGIERNVPGAGTLIAQEMARFYVACGAIDNAALLTFAKIPRGTKSGKVVLSKLEDILQDHDLASGAFESFHDQILVAVSEKIREEEGEIGRREDKAENSMCKEIIHHNRREKLVKKRNLMLLVSRRGTGRDEVLWDRRVFNYFNQTPVEYTHPPRLPLEEMKKRGLLIEPRGTRRVAWEKIPADKIKRISGLIHSNIPLEEFTTLMLDERVQLQRKIYLWKSITPTKRASLLDKMDADLAEIVQEWTAEKDSGEVDTSRGNGKRKDVAVRPKAGPRADVVLPSFTVEQSELLMSQWMDGKVSLTRLTDDERLNSVRKAGVSPSPFCATVYKKKKGSSSFTQAETIAKATEERVSALAGVEDRIARHTGVLPHPHEMEQKLWSNGNPRKCRNKRISYGESCEQDLDCMMPFDAAVGNTTSRRRVEGNQGEYFAEPEGILRLYAGFRPGSAAFGIYRAYPKGDSKETHPSRVQPAYYATVVVDGVEIDYSWSSILEGLVPSQISERDPNGRILFERPYYAKFFAALNAALDSPLSITAAEDVSKYDRLMGNVPILGLLEERSNTLRGISYVVIKAGGMRGATHGKKIVTVLFVAKVPILKGKDNNKFELLIGGYEGGTESMISSLTEKDLLEVYGTGSLSNLDHGNLRWRSLWHLTKHGEHHPAGQSRVEHCILTTKKTRKGKQRYRFGKGNPIYPVVNGNRQPAAIRKSFPELSMGKQALDRNPITLRGNVSKKRSSRRIADRRQKRQRVVTRNTCM